MNRNHISRQLAGWVKMHPTLMGLAVVIGATATANAWRSPDDGGPPNDLTTPDPSLGAAARTAETPSDAGDATAESGGGLCWYKQKVRGCRRGCPFSPFDCQPQFDLPCTKSGDCQKKIEQKANCERDEKGCKAIRKRCGCAETGRGACCLGDGNCEELSFGECANRGGAWNFGEDCQSIRARVKKFEAKCNGGGTISITVRFRDNSQNGKTVTVHIGERIQFEIEVRGKTAKRSVCCFKGEQTVKLVDPQGCGREQVVNCP